MSAGSLFDFAAESARRAFQPQGAVRDIAVDLFRRLGETRTPDEAQAIAEQAGSQGAALIEIATLAAHRAKSLAAMAQEEESR